MEQRIQTLLELSNVQDIYPPTVPTAYDPIWLCEPDCILDAYRFAAYMQNQTVAIEPGIRLPGMFRFNGSFRGDLFTRVGHTRWSEVASAFYLKRYRGLATFEWQHSTLDYDMLMTGGINGLREKISLFEIEHKDEPDRLNFLRALTIVCDGIDSWCDRIATAYADAAKNAPEPRKTELLTTADIVARVPKNPPKTFREALVAMSVCYQFLPDSIGLADRYLYPFYTADIENGTLTRDEAKSLLQELFVIIKAHTVYNSCHADKGGEAHFAIGGYNAQMVDNWNELSELILESLLELPMCIPQISIRWTKDTPIERLYHILDCERHDKYKRIAVISDETRVPAHMNILKLPVEIATGYTTVGCNETAFPSGMDFTGMQSNIAPSITRLTKEYRQEFAACADFDAVFDLFKRILGDLLDELMDIQNKFNCGRAKDENVVSSLFMHGCIERAKSATQGGADRFSAYVVTNGLISVIDSLCIIKQLVFDEKKLTADALCDLLDDNWGDGEMRRYVLRYGKFFGNNDSHSNAIAQRVTTAFHDLLSTRRDMFGHRLLLGAMDGYNPHSVWFGELTGATPDGRLAGDPFMVGIGQSNGKDRRGLTPLLLSVAHMDPTNILTANLVFNLALDETMVKNDAHFEKTVQMLDTFLREGGTQFQLNYVSRETLLDATAHPEQYSSLRVRVSGFSAYYTRLSPLVQKELLARTEIHG